MNDVHVQRGDSEFCKVAIFSPSSYFFGCVKKLRGSSRSHR